MLGIDSNVLVRWLGGSPDAPEQRARVAELVERGGDGLHLNLVVLVEAVWTLKSTFGKDRATIARALRALLAHPRVRVQQRAVVERALDAYETGGAGFADHLIGALNAASGCRTTLTFDKAAAKGDHFTLLT